ncbi:MAG TPA: glycosyltransferase family 39 protein [Polyangiaceae bacterium]|jgi:4-amino-4-deoxy-L-arabinose transferase-like glycosyltransferase|nr:glycosyltransferase family 39 protein [Polyangiaceae bacterium]
MADETIERRLSLALTAVATAWFTLAAAWGLFGPPLAGHYASSASVGIIAENMLRWHIWGPVWEYTTAPPSPAQYYCHHPWGIFWTTAAFMNIFGRHDFICRLPAVLLSAATPPLLYLLGRAMWRPLAGAMAAAAFVVLPISLAFAHFNALEVPVIAYTTLGLWAWVRHRQTWKRRYLALALVAFSFALHADWPAYVLIAVLLAHGLFFPRGPRVRQHARAWVLTATLCVLTFVLYVYLFHRAGKLGDLIQSYEHRAGGEHALAARRYWIELCFTKVALVLGVLATPIVLVRAKKEIAPLAVLVMATAQYLLFPQGADIHIYWPHYFAAYFALAMGALTATLFDRLKHIALLLLIPLLIILRDGVPALAYARATGGRFNEKGLFIESEGDKIEFLRWLAPKTSVALHASMKPNWSQVWSLGVPIHPKSDILIADTRFLDPREQERLAANHHVVAVGPYWYTDRREPHAPIDAFSFTESEPKFFTWYFVDGTEPVRTLRPDPYLTWELRTHFAQPAEQPREAPATFEEQRIAHNMAVARGHVEEAAALERRLELREPRQPLRVVGSTERPAVELLGVRYEPGVRPLLTLAFRAGAAVQDRPIVKSQVIGPPIASTTMADPTIRDVAPPTPIPPARWREGFIYSQRIPIRKRPGRERFTLVWGASAVVVLELP